MLSSAIAFAFASANGFSAASSFSFQSSIDVRFSFAHSRPAFLAFSTSYTVVASLTSLIYLFSPLIPALLSSAIAFAFASANGFLAASSSAFLSASSLLYSSKVLRLLFALRFSFTWSISNRLVALFIASSYNPNW